MPGITNQQLYCAGSHRDVTNDANLITQQSSHVSSNTAMNCDHSNSTCTQKPMKLPPHLSVGVRRHSSTQTSIFTPVKSASSISRVMPSFSPMSCGPICRICHEGDSKEELVSLCRCAGTVGLAHIGCVEKWLSSANSDICEICNFKYITVRKPKPFREWILRPSSPEDSRNLVGDTVCFILLTPLAVISAYLCVMGASHYLSWKTQWEATGLVILAMLLAGIYLVWISITVRYHWRVWCEWRSTHQNVHLVRLQLLSQSGDDLNNNNSVLDHPQLSFNSALFLMAGEAGILSAATGSPAKEMMDRVLQTDINDGAIETSEL